jgi:hypothetical protein
VRRARRAVVGLIVATHAFIVEPSASFAGTGLSQFEWNNANITLSTTAPLKNSNVTGFWQTLINSRACGVTIDGNFGNLTKAETTNWQNGLSLPSNNGVVDGWTWYLTQHATVTDSGGTYPRLQSLTGGVFGFSKYGYYGGGASGARLWWHGSSAQWYFSYLPNSNPDGSLRAATSAKNPSSYSHAACS